MNADLLNIAIVTPFFLVIFLIAEYFHKKRGVKPEITRKFVHVSTGLLTMCFPILFDSHWSVLIISAAFIVLLVIARLTSLLPSINAVERKTIGGFLFPLAVYFCFFMYSIESTVTLFYLPLLILALADPAAEFVGKTYPVGPYVFMGQTKTISGSLAFAFVAFMISCVCLIFLDHFSLIKALFVASIVAVFSSIIEGLSHFGIDNITVPLLVTMILLVFLI